MTLDVAALRLRIDTSLGDTALEGYLEAAYEAIDREIGPPGPLTELLAPGGGDVVILSRPAASITSVVEIDTELDPDDYALWTPTLLARLATGPFPASSWRGRIRVVYEVLSDDAERDRIATDLVRLSVTYRPGLSSIRIGEYAESYGQGTQGTKFAEERAAILASYHGGGGAFV